MKKRLLLLASALLLVPGTALAAGSPSSPNYVSQVGNGSPLPCLGASRNYAGVITTTVYLLGAQSSNSPSGGRQANVVYRLDLGYQANDPSRPSYSGTQTVSARVASTDGEQRALLTVKLQGSDGSSATLSGSAPVVMTSAGSLVFNSTSWTCASDDDAATSAGTGSAATTGTPTPVGGTSSAGSVGDRLAQLSSAVAGAGLDGGLTGYLQARLRDAGKELGKGHTATACNKLDDFVAKVVHSSPKIGQATAAWIAEAQAIKSSIGC